MQIICNESLTNILSVPVQLQSDYSLGSMFGVMLSTVYSMQWTGQLQKRDQGRRRQIKMKRLYFSLVYSYGSHLPVKKSFNKFKQIMLTLMQLMMCLPPSWLIFSMAILQSVIIHCLQALGNKTCQRNSENILGKTNVIIDCLEVFIDLQFTVYLYPEHKP